MAEFNWVDYTILVIFFFSVLAGFARGIVKELLSLLTWIAAFVVSSIFASKLAAVFTGSPGVQSVITESSAAVGVNTAQPISMVSLGLGFVCLFLATLLIGSIITHIISAAVDSAGVGLANRMLGGLFGLMRGFVVNVFFVFLVQLTAFEQEAWWTQSKLVPVFEPTVIWVGNIVYPGLESLKTKVGNSFQGAASTLIGNIYEYRS